MTYGDLPESGNGYGLSIRCLNPACSRFDEPWSPDRGDYWYMPDEREVTCGTCVEPMSLVRSRTVSEVVR